jgi:glycosyltransferase involved in cell wall biosynthesis
MIKKYNKRIAFVISDQHLVAHGGIGQFAKGFTEMSNRLNWKVDLILDKPSTNVFGKLVESLGARILAPKTPMSYRDHTGIVGHTDSMNFEKMLNFRNSIMQALNTNLYDMIICNSLEVMPAALSFNLNNHIPVIFYTHEESMVFRDTRKFKGVFNDSANEFFNNLMNLENMTVGTQSQRNADEIKNAGSTHVEVLPMPMSERELLKEYHGKREGVLYIGRWEDRKNPEAFLKIIKETKLPAKIMTNSNGAKKFQARLKELEITNYEIRESIVGKEKVDFIQSSRVHFNPSLRENYPFTFFECFGHMPSFVIDKSEWVTNFDSKFYTRLPLNEVGDAIVKAYDYDTKDWYAKGALEYVKSLDNGTSQKWIDFLTNFKIPQSKSDAAKINEYDTTKYADFITELERGFVSIEDVLSVLNNRSKFKIVYTDNDTYLSKDQNFEPEEDTVAGLFEFN